MTRSELRGLVVGKKSSVRQQPEISTVRFSTKKEHSADAFSLGKTHLKKSCREGLNTVAGVGSMSSLH